MAKTFRLFEKKRGERRTGSPLVGELGEALFFGLLFLLGTVSLTFHFIRPDPADMQLGMGFWLVVIVLTSFVLLGGGGLVYAILHIGTSAERRSALAKRAAGIDLLSETMPSGSDYPTVPRDANLTNSPGIRLAYRLPVSHTTAWQLLAATLFCLIWNGITAVLLTITITGYLHQQPDWFLTAGLIPFLSIGTWAIHFFVQQLMLHTGIGPTNVEISHHPLYAGEACDVYLTQGGRLSFKQLELRLVCIEETSYHQGTDIRTDEQLVFEQVLLHEDQFEVTPSQPLERDCLLLIPSSAMHSLQANHNSVHWKLIVRGELERWPVFERVFPLIVYPGSAKLELMRSPRLIADGTTH